MDLHKAEIFKSGTWNGMKFEDSDLENIAAAFNKLSQQGRVPLKFGHNSDQEITDGQPALGWVQRVWREGSKLMADFADIPTVVYETIKKGLYKFVSIELLQNVEAIGEQFDYVLDAVALLGADIPAVSDLKDLQALTLSRTPGVRFDARVAFSRQEKLDANGGERKMGTENESDVDKLRQLTVTEVRLKAEREKLDAERAEFKRQQDAAAESAKKEQIGRHRQDRKDQFDKAIKEGRITSGQRDTAERLLRFSDDAAVLNVTAKDVEDAINAFASANPRQRKGGGGDRQSFSRSGTSGDGSDRRDENLQPGDELAEKIAAQQADFDAKGKVWGPEDAASFARANRNVVRAWMDSIG